MRCAAILCLLCVMALDANPADARGADASEVGRNLTQRGYELLRRAEQALARGEEAQGRRDAKEAERIFAAVLNQEPTNAQAALLGGQSATLAGDIRSAAAWVDRFARLTPAGRDSADYQFLVAFVQLLGEHRPDRALRSLTRMYTLDTRARAAERDNLWFRALNDHGKNLFRAKKHDEAIVQFRLAARIARRLGNRRSEYLMLANIGATLMEADRYIEATEVYEGLAKADKENPLWHYRLALCHANQSRFADAVPVYREVMRLLAAGHRDAGWPDGLEMVQLRLGNCLRHLAEQQRDAQKTAAMYTDAEANIRAYIASAPENAVGHKWLGVLLFENLNKPYEALPAFRRAFELDPICDDSLRYMLQIRRSFPPPKGTTKEAWQEPIAALAKDLEEGAERRRKARDAREDATGDQGCN